MALDFLSLYGTSFQTKVIALLITDKDFLSQVYDILTPDFFESDANKEIVTIIQEYYSTYQTSPGFQVFAVKMAELNDTILKATIMEQLRSIKQHIENPEDLKYIKTEFANFCRNQNYKSATLQTVNLVKSGQYDAIEQLWKEAFTAGKSRNIGLDYTANVEERYSKNARVKIVPTEWNVINEILDGGLGEGDLGVFVGTAGTGKSWSLVSLGLHALSMGKNVLHFTMELNEAYTGRRYDSRLTGIAAQNLKYHVDDVKQKVGGLKGRLFIQYYPTKTASVVTLRAAINKAAAFGFVPDLVIVDYADLLKSENIHHQKQGSYYELGSIYEELRGLAGEMQIPLWTASQANKSAEEDDIITGDKVSESYKKVMTADFILSLSRKIEDKLANTARWFVIKNRYGPDGLTFPSKMDASIGRIEIFAAQSISGAETRKEMRNSNEVLRQGLANRYTDFEEESTKNKE
jgi:replicative DNA helicase